MKPVHVILLSVSTGLILAAAGGQNMPSAATLQAADNTVAQAAQAVTVPNALNNAVGNLLK